MLNIHRLSAEPPRDYTLAGSIVPICESVKNLGVVVDSDMKFSQHVSVLCRRTAILYCEPTLPTCVHWLNMLHKFVRHTYIWISSNINKLEAVQRRFTKRLIGMHDLDYTARLRALNIDSLEKRRLHKFTRRLSFCIQDHYMDWSTLMCLTFSL